jgi:hypothetical protein
VKNFVHWSTPQFSLPTAVITLFGSCWLSVPVMAQSSPPQLAPQRTSANAAVMVKPVITIAQVPADSLLNQLEQLEAKQKALEAEIQSLKQQLKQSSPIDASTASTQAAASGPSSNLMFAIEPTFLKASGSGPMDYAIVDNGTALATAGEIARLQYENITTPRWRLNYRNPQSNFEISASHLGFNTRAEGSATRATNGFLFSTYSHPFQNDSADTASAAATLKYQATDLEIGQRIQVSDRFNLRAFAGLRSGNFDQDMVVNFNGRDFNNAVLTTSSSFTGIGPRLGAEMHWNLAKELTFFGRGAGSLLLGRRDLSTVETDNNGQDVVVDLADDRASQIIPGMEFALGLAWKPRISKSTNLNFQAGYEYQHWFNAGESLRFTDAATPGSSLTDQSDLSLRGLFLQFGILSTF